MRGELIGAPVTLRRSIASSDTLLPGTLRTERSDRAFSFRVSFHRRGDLSRNRCCSSLHRIAREMRVALRCLRLRVPEIMQADIDQPGSRPDATPGFLNKRCPALRPQDVGNTLKPR